MVMPADIQPLTSGLWPAFEDLFGKQGALLRLLVHLFPPLARCPQGQ